MANVQPYATSHAIAIPDMTRSVNFRAYINETAQKTSKLDAAKPHATAWRQLYSREERQRKLLRRLSSSACKATTAMLLGALAAPLVLCDRLKERRLKGSLDPHFIELGTL